MVDIVRGKRDLQTQLLETGFDPMNRLIIIENFGDILIFDSVTKAEKYIEPIDVLNDEYVIYDSRGYMLEAKVGPLNQISIRECSPNVNKSQELRKKMVNFLCELGVSQAWLTTASMKKIIKKALEFCKVD